VKTLLAAIFAAAGILYAIDTPKPLTDAQKDAFHKAQAIMILANAQAAEAERIAAEKRDAFQKVAKDICGNLQWQVDKDDNLTCVAVPAAKP
jgi:hypothetical protein